MHAQRARVRSDRRSRGPMRGLVTVFCGGLLLFAEAREATADPGAELRQAAAGYVEAFRKADAVALADQWTERATLEEGDDLIEGRDAIVAALVARRNQHPEGTLEVEVADIDLLAEPLARVSGVIRFTPRPGEKPFRSRFTSLRVREGTTWRIAESTLEPEQEAVLDELDWIMGTWKAAGAARPDGTKTEFEITYDKPLGDAVIVGRARYQRAGGPEVTALEVIHADRDGGLVRSWVFDSTGAVAEGVIESDGTTFHKSMVGTPAEGVDGNVARWVQVMAPTGDGRCTVHAIERSIDDVAMPDGEPFHLRKVSGR